MITLENAGTPIAGETQKIAYSATPAATTPLTEKRMFRIQTTTDAYIRIAPESAALAVVDVDAPITAGIPEYFRVPAGYVISAVMLTTAGSMSASPME